MPWVKCSEYCFNGISAKAYKSLDGFHCDGDYDIGIFFGSFESRALKACTSLPDDSFKKVIIVLFDDAKESQLRRDNDKILLECAKRISQDEPYVIDNIALQEIDIILNKIFYYMSNNLNNKGKIFFDIGGAPIPFFTGFLGYMKNLVFPPKITFFNPTGDYDRKLSGSSNNFSFTSGFFDNRWVPYFWGDSNPAIPRKYIFMLGHEGARSLWVYESCEPDIVEAVITDPGYKPEYKEKAIKANQLFLSEIGLSSEKLKKADASDVIDVWKQLLDLIKSDNKESNICFVPLGTKGHAIGCALCALSLITPSILYQMPRSYCIRDVPHGSELWKYEIIL